MKTNHEEFVAIFGAEVTELSAEVYSTKSDELLTSYQGREKELLINLRKLAFKQQVSGLCWSSFHGLQIITTILMQCHSLTVWRGEEGNALEIIGLVEELDLPKSPDELLATYDGREDELLKNSR